MSKRRRRRRHLAEKIVHVPPTPETLAKLKPWPMQSLLALGNQAGGLDADEFEAALQIVEAYRVLTCELGMATASLDRLAIGSIAHGHGGMSERDAERCATWFDWSMRLPIGLAVQLVAEIEDDAPIRSVDTLRMACRLWDKTRSERSRLDERPSVVVDIAGASYGKTQERVATGPGFLLAGSRRPLPLPTHAASALRPSGQIYPPADALSSRDPSTRWRRRW